MRENPSGARALSQIDIANSRELPADGNTNNTHPRCVSRLNAVTDTRPRTYQLSTIFTEISRGNASLANLADDAPYRTLSQVTTRARELRYTHGNLDAYNLLKKEMPQFTPAAVLSTRSEIQSFSDLVCLEWDGDIDVAYALTIGKQHPNVLAIWRSLSGNPKFLIPISPVSKDGDELTRNTFKHAWFDASLLFEDIGEAAPKQLESYKTLTENLTLSEQMQALKDSLADLKNYPAERERLIEACAFLSIGIFAAYYFEEYVTTVFCTAKYLSFNFFPAAGKSRQKSTKSVQHNATRAMRPVPTTDKESFLSGRRPLRLRFPHERLFV